MRYEEKLLILISLTGLIAILSSTASKSPTLPLFAESLGADPSQIGLIASASTITGIVVNVLAGGLSDIYGRRKLLLLSGFFFASSPFLYLLVDDPLKLLIVRVYHGVATAVFTPVAIAVISDLYREKRGEYIGYFSSATLIGRLIAPTMAGTFITLYSFYGTYLVCGLLGLTTLILIIPFPETRIETSKGSRQNTKGFTRVLGDERIILAGVIMAITYFSMQSIETFLPLYLEMHGVIEWMIGLVFTIQIKHISSTETTCW